MEELVGGEIQDVGPLRLEGRVGQRRGEGEFIDGEFAGPIGAGEGELDDIVSGADPEAGGPILCVRGFRKRGHELHVEDAALLGTDCFETTVGDLEKDGEEDEFLLADREGERAEEIFGAMFLFLFSGRRGGDGPIEERLDLRAGSGPEGIAVAADGEQLAGDGRLDQELPWGLQREVRGLALQGGREIG